MYHNGDGVSQDKAEAAKWYRKAAEQGMDQARVNLGVIYERGEAVIGREGIGVEYLSSHITVSHRHARFTRGLLRWH